MFILKEDWIILVLFNIGNVFINIIFLCVNGIKDFVF